jgi:hypothetical protein
MNAVCERKIDLINGPKSRYVQVETFDLRIHSLMNAEARAKMTSKMFHHTGLVVNKQSPAMFARECRDKVNEDAILRARNLADGQKEEMQTAMLPWMNAKNSATLS